MTDAQELTNQVREAIAATFGITAADVAADAAQEDVEGWDSVGHLNLMLMLEDTFDVQLEVSDMERLTSVPAIVSFLG